MARLSEGDKTRNEAAVRAAIDRLLRGEIPPGGRLDLKTLAAEARVTRTGFYPKKNRDGTDRPGPYQHLAEEFERRLRAKQASGEVVDPRDAQIERLKAEVTELRKRVTARDATVDELTAFQTLAVSRIAAQQAEITRLRKQIAGGGRNVVALSRRSGDVHDPP
ncbi:hypothetical protein ABT083_23510 [Streptomyces goshikiensis]|uniref:hypothetical protein n=1 Tax=Streptomyces TaxID=1883 RepID=UPI000939E035|nr:hypothetical protein [Streptomyces sp. CB03578]OKI44417.1 hypothetical protein A6A28_02295 [Streptomyces sp. CB03578]